MKSPCENCDACEVICCMGFCYPCYVPFIVQKIEVNSNILAGKKGNDSCTPCFTKVVVAELLIFLCCGSYLPIVGVCAVTELFGVDCCEACFCQTCILSGGNRLIQDQIDVKNPTVVNSM